MSVLVSLSSRSKVSSRSTTFERRFASPQPALCGGETTIVCCCCKLAVVLFQDTAEDIKSIDSCEYIWEAGVGFAQSPPFNYVHDLNR